MEETYLAHLENEAGEVQLLSDHLKFVADRAGQFASKFEALTEGRQAGLLHDLGKARHEFLQYLRKDRGRSLDTHHSVYGAALAFQKQWPCAFAIAGHHSGLPNRHHLQSLVDDESDYLIGERLPPLAEWFAEVIGPMPDHLCYPAFLMRDDVSEWSVEFYIRMIFSCLVDADRLDTEAHARGRERTTWRMKDVCEASLSRIMAERALKPTHGVVNEVRHAIFEECLKKAECNQGFFSLTVPTGGGKTLSGMAFALAHARKWNLERIIVVIPYLSIIEQNATEYKRILDPENLGLVVEHHSAVPLSEEESDRPSSPADWAVENWDAPVIVTTSVQFIETLFASSPSKCRKLHNMARSVIMLDEVQTFPTHLLNPLLNVLREMKENYGSTFLFMTATQPAFRRNTQFLSEGFSLGEVIEVNEQTKRTFAVLRRVAYSLEGVLAWDELADRMARSAQVMCLLNVRKQALELWQRLRETVCDGERDSVYHLSSSMCPEHRSFALGAMKDPGVGSIRFRLNQGLPCRLVATQVVEAGVDLDFPVVFRAMGPLDSIVQAAGRCNREGRLLDGEKRPVPGQVVIFTPGDHGLPKGIYQTATGCAAAFLNSMPLDMLATEPDAFAEYFSQLFQMADTDHSRPMESSIQDDRAELRFRDVSRKAKVIQDEGVPVVVPYGRGRALIEEARLSGHGPRFDYRALRALQRFMVNMRTRDFEWSHELGLVSRLVPHLAFFALEEGCYNKDLGIVLRERPLEDFVI